MSSGVSVNVVDFHDPEQQKSLLELLDMYARDPMGGGEALADDVKRRLCSDLANTPSAVSFLAYADGLPVGLLNAMMGYSTFKAKPLMNVHDIAVSPAYRGQGVGQSLLAAAQTYALGKGCCKLTLEVLSGNHTAMRSYERFGFEQYSLLPENGQALFMQKWL